MGLAFLFPVDVFITIEEGSGKAIARRYPPVGRP